MNQKQIQQLMKEAQKMQSQVGKAQEEVEKKEFSFSAGGGAVELIMSGKKEVIKLNIKPEVIDPEDKEMLEDLITLAITNVIAQIETELESSVGSITGGLPF